MANTERNSPDQLGLRLPQPQPRVDPASRPFVGNESVDDNLVECAQVAIWNAIGRAERLIDLSISGGVATLSGVLQSGAQRQAAEVAVATVTGVSTVINTIEVLETLQAAIEPGPGAILIDTPFAAEVPNAPYAYVVRYCGIDEVSLSSAIRQAVGELDALFVANSLSLPAALVVSYKNRQSTTITVEIGMASPGANILRSDDVHVGHTPTGPMIKTDAAAGLKGLLEAMEQLTMMARARGVTPIDGWSQRFESPTFRPWTGHPAGPLFLAVRETPPKGRPTKPQL
ncbi:MAG: BON domain-containing protein [Devosia sp.]